MSTTRLQSETTRRTALRRRAAGFTLAELLVATMLLSIVMTSVYTLFHSAVGSWRAAEQDFNMYREARLALSAIQYDVNNLVAETAHLFEGENDSVTMFVLAEPMDVEESTSRHLMRVHYRYNRAGDELVREEALVEAALPAAPLPGESLDRSLVETENEEKFVVAENVRQFHVRYLWLPVPTIEEVRAGKHIGPFQPHSVAEHRAKWGFPQGVEIKLVFEDPEMESNRYVAQTRLPIRTRTTGLNRKKLEEMLGGLL